MPELSLALMTGIDIPIPELQLTLHQPTIKEISYMGDRNFLIGISCLCVDKKAVTIEDKTLLDNINNFQIFMKLMEDSQFRERKNIVLDTISLILPNYICSFIVNRSILFTDKKTQELTYLDENNFNIFQDIIRKVFYSGLGKNEFNTNSKEGEEIARKLQRHRERVAQQQGGGQDSAVSQYLSVLTVGLESMSLNDCMNLTMYQLFDLVERYMLYNSWDMNIRARMAGAKVETQPENWMKSIH